MSPAVPFDVSSRRDGRRAHIELRGELLVDGAARLREALDACADADCVVVDLRGLTFVDSIGVGVLVRGYMAANAAGRRHEFCGPLQPGVRRTLELSGLLDLLPVTDA